jgi:bifunctional DNase/RNase
MIEVRVAHLGLDRTTNTPVVILQEQQGERVLPIWIGPAEASAIAMELAGVKFARPLTHDLLKQVIVGLGAELRKVIITRVQDNTYFAELHIYRGDQVVQIDARPSDSIALALRLKAPIFTSEELLDLTSVDTGGAAASSGTPGPLDADALKTYLQNLDPEDFGKFTP